MSRNLIARLKVTPAVGAPPVTNEIFRLYEKSGLFFLEHTEVQGLQRTRKTIQREPQAVAAWFGVLRSATVPAMPVSPLVCDSEYIELLIEGEHSTLTLGWWTIAPEGAEALGEFADWMRGAWPEDEMDADDESQEVHMPGVQG